MKKLYFLLLRIGTLVLLATLLAPYLQAQTTEDISAQLELLDQQLTRLRDVSDIEKLQHAYGYYKDQQQWVAVRELFSNDAMLELGGRGRFLGKDRIFEFLRTGYGPATPVPGRLHEELQLQGLITLSADGSSAKGRWSGFVVDSDEWRDLSYENDYVKEDGVWKLRVLHASTNLQATLASGWASNTLPDTRPESALPVPDLPPSRLYLSFPNYNHEPFHYPNPVTGRTAPPPDPAAGGRAFGQP